MTNCGKPAKDFREMWVFGITREHAIAAAKNAMANQGYAITVHGSLVKDVDLVAIPWCRTAHNADRVAEIIAAAIPGTIDGPAEVKPYGRRAYMIWPNCGAYGWDRWYVDLSVMPRIDPGLEPVYTDELLVVTDNHDPANHHPVGETHQPKRTENEVVSQPEQPS